MSKNSEAQRPVIPCSIDRAVRERLDAHCESTGLSRSMCIEKAVVFYLDDLDKLAENYERVGEFLHKNYESMENLIGIENSNAESLLGIGKNVEFLARTIERLFGVRRVAPQIPSVDRESFNNLVRDATGYYGAAPESLRPNTETQNKELKSAAMSDAIQNLKHRAVAVMNSIQEFLIEGMEIVVHSLHVSLIDRRFSSFNSTESSSEDEGFLVCMIGFELNFGDLVFSFPEERPYFSLARYDARPVSILTEDEKIAQVLPVIVADYIAYRKFENEGQRPLQP